MVTETRVAPGERIVLSVVATVYNHAATVRPLLDEIRGQLDPLGISYEILLVDDASRDEGEAVIAEECARDPRVRGFCLARNYGQQIAASAGICEARGEFVAVMDGDLQNPPSALPALLEEVKKGFDIVYTVSDGRKSWTDELTSRLFWYVVRHVLRLDMVPNQLMMKIMTRRYVEAFRRYGETSRVVAGIAADLGHRHSVLTVENRRRPGNGSGYSFLGRLELCIEMIISLSARPLIWLIYLGFLGMIGSTVLLAYYLGVYLFDHVPSGYTSIMMVMLFFGSVMMMMAGIIGRYLYVIYNEVRRRPLFFFRARYNDL